MKKICISCGIEFEAKHYQTMICSDECRAMYKRKKLKEWVSKNKDWTKEYRNITKDKRNTERREKYHNDKDHRDKLKAKVKDYNKRNPNRKFLEQLRYYGITLDCYNDMMAIQSGKCAICGRDGKLYIDHDHISGKVRGLLCNNCNFGLGHFKDSSALLYSAIEYLEHSNA